MLVFFNKQAKIPNSAAQLWHMWDFSWVSSRLLQMSSEWHVICVWHLAGTVMSGGRRRRKRAIPALVFAVSTFEILRGTSSSFTHPTAAWGALWPGETARSGAGVHTLGRRR